MAVVAATANRVTVAVVGIPLAIRRSRLRHQINIAALFSGTIGEMGHRPAASPPASSYREFAPAPALAGVVKAFFSFMPYAPRPESARVGREALLGAAEPFNLPMLADARASLVLDLTHVCHVDRGWSTAARLDARVIGPRRQACHADADYRAEMVGAYLEPGAIPMLFGMPASEFTDRSVPLESLWGRQSLAVLADAAPLDEASRIGLLERLLLGHLNRPAHRVSVDVPSLATWVQCHPVGVSVESLAEMVGVSRRQLARQFERAVGVSPKRFCRLARFKRGLAYAGAGTGVPWASVASDLGYSDQSHLIAEFQELAGLTPVGLATRRWFHPFILDAQASATPSVTRVDRASREKTGKPAV